MEWRGIEVAPDRTHHLRDGRPLYEQRFDDVLAFHAPGLAAVRAHDEAWHIDASGSPAYARTFSRTFGFYEERAAVEAGDGWHHILADGSGLYRQRHAWCGNYQGGRCVVRHSDGSYAHVDRSGQPAYAERWRYAGDYRDGVAVVQGADGLSTHVNAAGSLLHGRWFLDLDVFHKGLARARDDDGWTHVDRAGRPAYERRFAMVEPFYNGQARVERSDGGLDVIDERGRTLGELRSGLRSDFAELSRDLVGFWRTQAICAAVELNVLETLPADAAKVAYLCGLDGRRASRFLRALSELGLVRGEGGTWAVTERGGYLRRDHPLTLADAAVEYGRGLAKRWEALPALLRAEGPRAPADVFEEVASDPARVAGHQRMLRSYARHDYGAVPAALALRGDETVIDAGGGVGVLAELLARRYPRLRVVLLERPEVIRLLALADDVAERIMPRHADLFRPWAVTADAVVLSRVLHDWEDDAAGRILRNARATLGPGGRLFAVEMLAETGAAGGLCDLHLLAVTGGKERTAEQFAKLFEDNGFRFKETRRLPALPSLIVGEAT